MSQLSLLAGAGPVAEPPPGSSDDFYTPRRHFEPWHREFGFTLDPCASPESAKVPRYFDYHQDGLAQSWGQERVFCNPPYSDIAPWVAKAWAELLHGACELVVMLLPAWTDRRWWQEDVEPWRWERWPSLTHERASVSLQARFLPRIQFGFPGDPEGTSPEAKAMGAKIYPVLLVFESPGEMQRKWERRTTRLRAGGTQ